MWNLSNPWSLGQSQTWTGPDPYVYNTKSGSEIAYLSLSPPCGVCSFSTELGHVQVDSSKCIGHVACRFVKCWSCSRWPETVKKPSKFPSSIALVLKYGKWAKRPAAVSKYCQCLSLPMPEIGQKNKKNFKYLGFLDSHLCLKSLPKWASPYNFFF